MAKRAVKTAEVIDLPAVRSEDEQFTEQMGGAITAFVAGLGAFFKRATALELHAKDTLARVEALKAPTTEDEDVRIQEIVRGVSAEEKDVEAEWGICQKVGALHKRLTGKRGIAQGYLTQAKAKGNALHNVWKEAELRRVARENEERRVAAEKKAQEDRDAELARSEAAALKAEQDSPTLSAREQAFVDHHFIGAFQGNAAAQARNAGYKDPAVASARLLAMPKVQQAIQAKQRAAEIRQQAAAVKAAPLDVQVETVRPNIGRAAGAHDMTTHGAVCDDERALIDAVLRGGLGIPTDVLMVNPVKLNEYGRSMHELVNRWPGVRYTKKTGVV